MAHPVVKSVLLVALLGAVLTEVRCLDFSFPEFRPTDEADLLLNGSNILLGAIQVTYDLFDVSLLRNAYGRALYKDSFRLWKAEGKGRKQASFNTTFVINISNTTDPVGEGMAFILTSHENSPVNSSGKWLGIVNEKMNGSKEAHTVAVEFDTRKSYPEDLDNNHVGVDVNSIYSMNAVSLSSHGVHLTTGSNSENVTVVIQYDGENITVFAAMGNSAAEAKKNQVLFMPIDLSAYLTEEVFVGFSGSTGTNYTQRNCVRSWEFQSTNINTRNKSWWIWIPILSAIALLSVCIAFYWYWQWRRQRDSERKSYASIESLIHDSSLAPRKFRLRELKKATGNFNPKNKLGRGGFGTVYKGTVENMQVAIKRVSEDSTQGKDEFIAEVTTIGSLHHKNLVRLIGWCYERNVFLLVYEYLPNSSLDKYIFWDEKTGIDEVILNWRRRHTILCGVAWALDYLHNRCDKKVLHRDVKASNIMLDSEFNAKLGDFGLARTIQQKDQTHRTTNIAGTPGYMAPESFLTSRATVETDVYAFGVLVLEVVCGRNPGIPKEQDDYNNSIAHWIWELYRQGRILDAVDSRMKGEQETKEMENVLLLGLACCHPNPNERPSMKTVGDPATGEQH